MERGGIAVVRPEDRRFVQGLFPGTYRELMCDAQTPTNSLVAGIVRLTERGNKVSLHSHTIEEFQYILSGTGLLRDGQGNEYPLAPDTCIYCSPGPDAAHEYENTGDSPFSILFVFPSPGGEFPQIFPLNDPGSKGDS